MRLLQCMASIAPARGGPSTVVRELSRALADRQVSVTVAAHDDAGQVTLDELGHTFDARVDLRLFRLTTGTWQYSHDYVSWLRYMIRDYDFVLIHSMFLSHTAIAARVAAKASVPYAVRPHGSLTENDLRSKRLRKKLYLNAVDGKSLRHAEFLFCTSEQEAAACRRHGFANTATIPLGVGEELFRPIPPSQRHRRTMLFLGRIAEKKGIDIIVRSLAEPSARQAGLRAHIVGPDDHGLRQTFADLAVELGVQEAVTFSNFVGGEAKNDLLRNAGMFVLPSRDENFGVAVAEALATGLPAVVSPGVSHAPAIRRARAGHVVLRCPRELAQAAVSIATLPGSEYVTMSIRAQEMASERYRWSSAASRLIDHVGKSR